MFLRVVYTEDFGQSFAYVYKNSGWQIRGQNSFHASIVYWYTNSVDAFAKLHSEILHLM